jgi:protein O-GlcNAc transferase
MQAMDLFVDTLTYGAHSTGSDALWAGLPLITMRGNAFASRVGISLLASVGLEAALVADDEAEFVRLGAELLMHPYRLSAIRRRLARGLLEQGGLFDARAAAKVSE